MKASGDDYDFLVKNKDILSMIFIVSNTVVEEDPSVEAIKISVAKANGDKCERCWVYSHSVGEDHTHPTLCSRCATVLG